MINLASGFKERGYTADLVLVDSTGPLKAEIPANVRTIDLHAPRAFTSRALSSIPALVRYLRQVQPDILYTGLMTNLVALWSRRLAHVNTKIVISERNILSVEIKQFPKDIRFRLMPWMVKLFYPWADGIVAVSRAVSEDLARISGLADGRIKVIYNPVITRKLVEKSQQRISHSWFAAGEPPVILSVGRLTRQKDFPTLLKAFSLVRRTHRARLMVLGEGDERHNLEQQIQQLKIEQEVQLPGYIDNPYPYMKNAALFVLSSQFEGLPGVLIEALFCGVPVMATDCAGGSREILADGKFGQLVPVGDPVAMAEAISNHLAVDTRGPNEQSWKPFENEYVLDQYTTLFNEISSSAIKN